MNSPRAERLRRRLLRRLLVPLALLAGLATQGKAGAAQGAGTGEARTLEGRVVTPRRVATDSMVAVPVRGAWVTLHRVGRDSAGPLDSMRTGPTGAYRFSYRTTGGEAVYFASVTWGGIAYFTPPLREASVGGEHGEITVFDTTTRTFPLVTRGRHLIVGSLDSASQRTVIEVFEIGNDSLKTLVAADGASPPPTWSVAVPAAARDLRVNDSEISPDDFLHEEGRVAFFAPFAPGLKQLSFSYRIAAADFPVTITTGEGATVFEVLIEESRGTVISEHLVAVEPVNLEGRSFRRFLAQEIGPGEQILLDLPTSPGFSRNMYIAVVLTTIGVVVLLVLMRAMPRRQPTPMRVSIADGPASTLPLHEQLAREIAALDAVFARTPNPSDSVRSAYDRRRAELREALADALAESRPTH